MAATAEVIFPAQAVRRPNGHDVPGAQAPGANPIVLRDGVGSPILPQAVDPHQARRTMIMKAAYFLAEGRGFAPGHELEDWLAAEAAVGKRLSGA